MAATILQVRYQIQDTAQPYTFPDEIIQNALDEAADFLYRKYHSPVGIGLVSDNNPSILPVQNGVYGMGRYSWYDLWMDNAYNVGIDTPTGAKLQRLIASVDLMSTLLIPTSNRNPTGVSEGGLSIQWGGDYNGAIQVWNEMIEKIMFSLEPPFICMYNNF